MSSGKMPEMADWRNFGVKEDHIKAWMIIWLHAWGRRRNVLMFLLSQGVKQLLSGSILVRDPEHLFATLQARTGRFLARYLTWGPDSVRPPTTRNIQLKNRLDIPKNRDFPSHLSRSQSSHDPPWLWGFGQLKPDGFGNTNSGVESDTAWRCWWVVSPRKKVQLNNPPRTLIICNFIINNIEWGVVTWVSK